MVNNLKLLRKGKKVSQQKLADALGISQQSINQYENHNIEPDIDLLCRMAEYFDTSIDYLVGRTGILGQTEKAEIFSLSGDEAEMLTQYRALSERQKECIDLMLQTLSEK